MGNGRATADREQSHEFQVNATRRSHVKQTLVVNRRVVGSNPKIQIPSSKSQAGRFTAYLRRPVPSR
jgi:hypothetical protein